MTTQAAYVAFQSADEAEASRWRMVLFLSVVLHFFVLVFMTLVHDLIPRRTIVMPGDAIHVTMVSLGGGEAGGPSPETGPPPRVVKPEELPPEPAPEKAAPPPKPEPESIPEPVTPAKHTVIDPAATTVPTPVTPKVLKPKLESKKPVVAREKVVSPEQVEPAEKPAEKTDKKSEQSIANAIASIRKKMESMSTGGKSGNGSGSGSKVGSAQQVGSGGNLGGDFHRWGNRRYLCRPITVASRRQLDRVGATAEIEH